MHACIQELRGDEKRLLELLNLAPSGGREEACGLRRSGLEDSEVSSFLSPQTKKRLEGNDIYHSEDIHEDCPADS
jgi:hypothetical protein